MPLEEIPELSDLPVIFISAYGRDETVARALEPGAADYIEPLAKLLGLAAWRSPQFSW